MDGQRAVLCDFGLAALMSEEASELATSTSSRLEGSWRWCTNEILLGGQRDLKSDIWAWGCLALEVRLGTVVQVAILTRSD